MITILGDAPFSDLKLQRRGNHGELEIDAAVIFVGWALLPVAVIDGQECPSYNRHNDKQLDDEPSKGYYFVTTQVNC